MHTHNFVYTKGENQHGNEAQETLHNLILLFIAIYIITWLYTHDISLLKQKNCGTMRASLIHNPVPNSGVLQACKPVSSTITPSSITESCDPVRKAWDYREKKQVCR